MSSSPYAWQLEPYNLLGKNGYTLPVDGELREYSIQDLQRNPVPNLIIKEGAYGANIKFWVHPKAELRDKLQFNFQPQASGTRIIIGPECNFIGQLFIYSINQSVIFAGGSPSVGHTGSIFARMWSPNNFLYLGHGSSSNGTKFEVAGDDRGIIVGDDCMFAHNVKVNTGDFDAIVDVDTNYFRNPAADVLIEPHVWLADDVTISKGVVVGLGSVVAAHSFVSKNVPRSTAVGGIPAKLIARNICWDRHGQPTKNIVERINDLKASVINLEVPLRMQNRDGIA